MSADGGGSLQAVKFKFKLVASLYFSTPPDPRVTPFCHARLCPMPLSRLHLLLLCTLARSDLPSLVLSPPRASSVLLAGDGVAARPGGRACVSPHVEHSEDNAARLVLVRLEFSLGLDALTAGERALAVAAGSSAPARVWAPDAAAALTVEGCDGDMQGPCDVGATFYDGLVTVAASSAGMIALEGEVDAIIRLFSDAPCILGARAGRADERGRALISVSAFSMVGDRVLVAVPLIIPVVFDAAEFAESAASTDIKAAVHLLTPTPLVTTTASPLPLGFNHHVRGLSLPDTAAQLPQHASISLAGDGAAVGSTFDSALPSIIIKLPSLELTPTAIAVVTISCEATACSGVGWRDARVDLELASCDDAAHTAQLWGPVAKVVAALVERSLVFLSPASSDGYGSVSGLVHVSVAPWTSTTALPAALASARSGICADLRPLASTSFRYADKKLWAFDARTFSLAVTPPGAPLGQEERLLSSSGVTFFFPPMPRLSLLCSVETGGLENIAVDSHIAVRDGVRVRAAEVGNAALSLSGALRDVARVFETLSVRGAHGSSTGYIAVACMPTPPAGVVATTARANVSFDILHAGAATPCGLSVHYRDQDVVATTHGAHWLPAFRPTSACAVADVTSTASVEIAAAFAPASIGILLAVPRVAGQPLEVSWTPGSNDAAGDMSLAFFTVDSAPREVRALSTSFTWSFVRPGVQADGVRSLHRIARAALPSADATTVKGRSWSSRAIAEDVCRGVATFFAPEAAASELCSSVSVNADSSVVSGGITAWVSDDGAGDSVAVALVRIQGAWLRSTFSGSGGIAIVLFSEDFDAVSHALPPSVHAFAQDAAANNCADAARAKVSSSPDVVESPRMRVGAGTPAVFAVRAPSAEALPVDWFALSPPLMRGGTFRVAADARLIQRGEAAATAPVALGHSARIYSVTTPLRSVASPALGVFSSEGVPICASSSTDVATVVVIAADAIALPPVALSFPMNEPARAAEPETVTVRLRVARGLVGAADVAAIAGLRVLSADPATTLPRGWVAAWHSATLVGVPSAARALLSAIAYAPPNASTLSGYTWVDEVQLVEVLPIAVAAHDATLTFSITEPADCLWRARTLHIMSGGRKFDVPLAAQNTSLSATDAFAIRAATLGNSLRDAITAALAAQNGVGSGVRAVYAGSAFGLPKDAASTTTARIAFVFDRNASAPLQNAPNITLIAALERFADSIEFNVSAIKCDASAVVSFSASVVPTRSTGTFQLSFRGVDTHALAVDAPAEVIRSALWALPTIGVGGVDVVDALAAVASDVPVGRWRVTFHSSVVAALAGPVPLLHAVNASVTRVAAGLAPTDLVDVDLVASSGTASLEFSPLLPPPRNRAVVFQSATAPLTLYPGSSRELKGLFVFDVGSAAAVMFRISAGLLTLTPPGDALRDSIATFEAADVDAGTCLQPTLLFYGTPSRVTSALSDTRVEAPIGFDGAAVLAVTILSGEAAGVVARVLIRVPRAPPTLVVRWNTDVSRAPGVNGTRTHWLTSNRGGLPGIDFGSTARSLLAPSVGTSCASVAAPVVIRATLRAPDGAALLLSTDAPSSARSIVVMHGTSAELADMLGFSGRLIFVAPKTSPSPWLVRVTLEADGAPPAQADLLIYMDVAAAEASARALLASPPAPARRVVPAIVVRGVGAFAGDLGSVFSVDISSRSNVTVLASTRASGARVCVRAPLTASAVRAATAEGLTVFGGVGCSPNVTLSVTPIAARCAFGAPRVGDDCRALRAALGSTPLDTRPAWLVLNPPDDTSVVSDEVQLGVDSSDAVPARANVWIVRGSNSGSHVNELVAGNAVAAAWHAADSPLPLPVTCSGTCEDEWVTVNVSTSVGALTAQRIWLGVLGGDAVALHSLRSTLAPPMGANICGDFSATVYGAALSFDALRSNALEALRGGALGFSRAGTDATSAIVTVSISARGTPTESVSVSVALPYAERIPRLVLANSSTGAYFTPAADGSPTQLPSLDIEWIFTSPRDCAHALATRASPPETSFELLVAAAASRGSVSGVDCMGVPPCVIRAIIANPSDAAIVVASLASRILYTPPLGDSVRTASIALAVVRDDAAASDDPTDRARNSVRAALARVPSRDGVSLVIPILRESAAVTSLSPPPLNISWADFSVDGHQITPHIVVSVGGDKNARGYALELTFAVAESAPLRPAPWTDSHSSLELPRGWFTAALTSLVTLLRATPGQGTLAPGLADCAARINTHGGEPLACLDEAPLASLTFRAPSVSALNMALTDVQVRVKSGAHGTALSVSAAWVESGNGVEPVMTTRSLPPPSCGSSVARIAVNASVSQSTAAGHSHYPASFSLSLSGCPVNEAVLVRIATTRGAVTFDASVGNVSVELLSIDSEVDDVRAPILLYALPDGALLVTAGAIPQARALAFRTQPANAAALLAAVQLVPPPFSAAIWADVVVTASFSNGTTDDARIALTQISARAVSDDGIAVARVKVRAPNGPFTLYWWPDAASTPQRAVNVNASTDVLPSLARGALLLHAPPFLRVATDTEVDDARAGAHGSFWASFRTTALSAALNPRAPPIGLAFAAVVRALWSCDARARASADADAAAPLSRVGDAWVGPLAAFNVAGWQFKPVPHLRDSDVDVVACELSISIATELGSVVAEPVATATVWVNVSAAAVVASTPAPVSAAAGAPSAPVLSFLSDVFTMPARADAVALPDLVLSDALNGTCAGTADVRCVFELTVVLDAVNAGAPTLQSSVVIPDAWVLPSSPSRTLRARGTLVALSTLYSFLRARTPARVALSDALRVKLCTLADYREAANASFSPHDDACTSEMLPLMRSRASVPPSLYVPIGGAQPSGELGWAGTSWDSVADDESAAASAALSCARGRLGFPQIDGLALTRAPDGRSANLTGSARALRVALSLITYAPVDSSADTDYLDIALSLSDAPIARARSRLDRVFPAPPAPGSLEVTASAAAESGAVAGVRVGPPRVAPSAGASWSLANYTLELAPSSADAEIAIGAALDIALGADASAPVDVRARLSLGGTPTVLRVGVDSTRGPGRARAQRLTVCRIVNMSSAGVWPRADTLWPASSTISISWPSPVGLSVSHVSVFAPFGLDAALREAAGGARAAPNATASARWRVLDPSREGGCVGFEWAIVFRGSRASAPALPVVNASALTNVSVAVKSALAADAYAVWRFAAGGAASPPLSARCATTADVSAALATLPALDPRATIVERESGAADCDSTSDADAQNVWRVTILGPTPTVGVLAGWESALSADLTGGTTADLGGGAAASVSVVEAGDGGGALWSAALKPAPTTHALDVVFAERDSTKLAGEFRFAVNISALVSALDPWGESVREGAAAWAAAFAAKPLPWVSIANTHIPLADALAAALDAALDVARDAAPPLSAARAMFARDTRTSGSLLALPLSLKALHIGDALSPDSPSRDAPGPNAAAALADSRFRSGPHPAATAVRLVSRGLAAPLSRALYVEKRALTSFVTLAPATAAGTPTGVVSITPRGGVPVSVALTENAPRQFAVALATALPGAVVVGVTSGESASGVRLFVIGLLSPLPPLDGTAPSLAVTDDGGLKDGRLILTPLIGGGGASAAGEGEWSLLVLRGESTAGVVASAGVRAAGPRSRVAIAYKQLTLPPLRFAAVAREGLLFLDSTNVKEAVALTIAAGVGVRASERAVTLVAAQASLVGAQDVSFALEAAGVVVEDGVVGGRGGAVAVTVTARSGCVGVGDIRTPAATAVGGCLPLSLRGAVVHVNTALRTLWLHPSPRWAGRERVRFTATAVDDDGTVSLSRSVIDVFVAFSPSAHRPLTITVEPAERLVPAFGAVTQLGGVKITAATDGQSDALVSANVTVSPSTAAAISVDDHAIGGCRFLAPARNDALSLECPLDMLNSALSTLSVSPLRLSSSPGAVVSVSVHESRVDAPPSTASIALIFDRAPRSFVAILNGEVAGVDPVSPRWVSLEDAVLPLRGLSIGLTPAADVVTDAQDADSSVTALIAVFADGARLSVEGAAVFERIAVRAAGGRLAISGSVKDVNAALARVEYAPRRGWNALLPPRAGAPADADALTFGACPRAGDTDACVSAFFDAPADAHPIAVLDAAHVSPALTVNGALLLLPVNVAPTLSRPRPLARAVAGVDFPLNITGDDEDADELSSVAAWWGASGAAPRPDRALLTLTFSATGGATVGVPSAIARIAASSGGGAARMRAIGSNTTAATWASSDADGLLRAHELEIVASLPTIRAALRAAVFRATSAATARVHIELNDGGATGIARGGGARVRALLAAASEGDRSRDGPAALAALLAMAHTSPGVTKLDIDVDVRAPLAPLSLTWAGQPLPRTSAPRALAFARGVDAPLSGWGVTDDRATNVTLTLAAAHGLVRIAEVGADEARHSGAGFAVLRGGLDPRGDALLVLRGAPLALNAALSRLRYRAPSDWDSSISAGADTVELTASADGTLIADATARVDAFVLPVVCAPRIAFPDATFVDEPCSVAAASRRLVTVASVRSVIGTRTRLESVGFVNEATAFDALDAQPVTLTLDPVNGVVDVPTAEGLLIAGSGSGGGGAAAVTLRGPRVLLARALSEGIFFTPRVAGDSSLTLRVDARAGCAESVPVGEVLEQVRARRACGAAAVASATLPIVVVPAGLPPALVASQVPLIGARPLSLVAIVDEPRSRTAPAALLRLSLRVARGSLRITSADDVAGVADLFDTTPAVWRASDGAASTAAAALAAALESYKPPGATPTLLWTGSAHTAASRELTLWGSAAALMAALDAAEHLAPDGEHNALDAVDVVSGAVWDGVERAAGPAVSVFPLRAPHRARAALALAPRSNGTFTLDAVRDTAHAAVADAQIEVFVAPRGGASSGEIVFPALGDLLPRVRARDGAKGIACSPRACAAALTAVKFAPSVASPAQSAIIDAWACAEGAPDAFASSLVEFSAQDARTPMTVNAPPLTIAMRADAVAPVRGFFVNTGLNTDVRVVATLAVARGRVGASRDARSGADVVCDDASGTSEWSRSAARWLAVTPVGITRRVPPRFDSTNFSAAIGEVAGQTLYGDAVAGAPTVILCGVLRVSGTASDVNAALEGLLYAPPSTRTSAVAAQQDAVVLAAAFADSPDAIAATSALVDIAPAPRALPLLSTLTLTEPPTTTVKATTPLRLAPVHVRVSPLAATDARLRITLAALDGLIALGAATSGDLDGNADAVWSHAHTLECLPRACDAALATLLFRATRVGADAITVRAAWDDEPEAVSTPLVIRIAVRHTDGPPVIFGGAVGAPAVRVRAGARARLGGVTPIRGDATAPATRRRVNRDAAGALAAFFLTRGPTVGAEGIVGAVDGAGSSASFNKPGGVALAPNGDAYVADAGGGSLRRVSRAGAVTTIAQGLVEPAGVALSSTTLFVADAVACAIYAFDAKRAFRATASAHVALVIHAGAPGVCASFDGIGTDARFATPRGLALDAVSETLYVADTGSTALRALRTRGGLVAVTTLATGIVGLWAIAPAPGGGVVASAWGTVILGAGGVSADTGLLVRVSANGVVSALAGGEGDGVTASWDGEGTSAAFGRVRALTTDAAGNAFFVDAACGCVRRADVAGSVVTVGAGHVRAGANLGIVSSPDGGAIVLTDEYAHVVQRVDVSSRSSLAPADAIAFAGAEEAAVRALAKSPALLVSRGLTPVNFADTGVVRSSIDPNSGDSRAAAAALSLADAAAPRSVVRLLSWWPPGRASPTLVFTTSAGGLWLSDGAPGGAVAVDVSGATSVRAPTPAVNGTLFFSATTTTAGDELWSLRDGTAALVADIWPGPASAAPTWLTSFVPPAGGPPLLLFSAASAFFGRELWASDGSAAGTVLLFDVAAGAPSSSPSWMTAVPGPRAPTGVDDASDVDMRANTPHAFAAFVADDALHGEELWRTDGVPALAKGASGPWYMPRTPGTALVADIRAGAGSSSPAHLYAAPRLSDGAPPLLWFSADDGVAGREPWVSDGTRAWLVGDVRPGPLSSDPTVFAAFGPFIFFAASHDATGRELWRVPYRADGAPILVADAARGAASSFPALLNVVATRTVGRHAGGSPTTSKNALVFVGAAIARGCAAQSRAAACARTVWRLDDPSAEPARLVTASAAAFIDADDDDAGVSVGISRSAARETHPPRLVVLGDALFLAGVAQARLPLGEQFSRDAVASFTVVDEDGSAAGGGTDGAYFLSVALERCGGTLAWGDSAPPASCRLSARGELADLNDLLTHVSVTANTDAVGDDALVINVVDESAPAGGSVSAELRVAIAYDG